MVITELGNTKALHQFRSVKGQTSPPSPPPSVSSANHLTLPASDAMVTGFHVVGDIVNILLWIAKIRSQISVWSEAT